VELRRNGRTVTTRVIDRGPYVAGRTFDLTAPAANRLGVGNGLANVQWRRR
jgi:rare lipoprotein A (peptidoglycan hydrolase)